MNRTAMNSRAFLHSLGGIALTGILLSGVSVAWAQKPLPLPKATLVPVEPWRYTSPDLKTITPDKIELMSADRYLVPEYLSQEGYVEEEYLITGTANVYDWGGDGKLMIKVPNAPYGSRIRGRASEDAPQISRTRTR